MQRLMPAMRTLLPLAVILPGFSLSAIPEFLIGPEMRAIAANFVAQVLIGVADAVIGVVVDAAFGLI